MTEDTLSRQIAANGAARPRKPQPLLRGGYPPVAVRPQDRPAYIGALQDAQAGRGSESFDHLLYERLDTTLDECLSALQEALAAPTQPEPPTRQTDKPAP